MSSTNYRAKYEDLKRGYEEMSTTYEEMRTAHDQYRRLYLAAVTKENELEERIYSLTHQHRRAIAKVAKVRDVLMSLNQFVRANGLRLSASLQTSIENVIYHWIMGWRGEVGRWLRRGLFRRSGCCEWAGKWCTSLRGLRSLVRNPLLMATTSTPPSNGVRNGSGKRRTVLIREAEWARCWCFFIK